MATTRTFDVAVIGAGVFGAWSAWHLTRRGRRVILLDEYGPGNSRASSGGETRIIRMGYGTDEIYTRSSQRSLAQWKRFFLATGQQLFHETGVLWLAGADDSRVRQTMATLTRCEVPFEPMDQPALQRRYPQISFDRVTHGFLEPKSGVLLARRATAAVAEDAVKEGAEFRMAQVETPRGRGRLDTVKCGDGETLAAGQFVFACGSWLGKVFPEILGQRIFPTRQEVFFLGVPPGDERFASPALPTWLFQEDEYYGMPNIEGRGLKIALDRHGEGVDPDTQSRIPTLAEAETVKEYVASRFPALRDAPVVETRVCQYENTSNGDFLIDRHPELENVWFVGGGSGHGFKHGPAVGEYLTGQLLDRAKPEPRFSLDSKATTQRRAVY
ncbi:MAG TPA: FAD-dependent oxidoreductase [Candidatus Methylomirabilis sp.]|nr:FAD-dependent oxidoreductase [Candidatus Methylomirabilis sp.]